MKKFRMLACASTFVAFAAAGCAGAPETTEETATATVPEEAAAPAIPVADAATSEGEPAERRKSPLLGSTNDGSGSMLPVPGQPPWMSL